MPQLGVNIDHVATVRQARRTTEPDPGAAAAAAELGGADLITVHLREDRRHIQDRDLRILRETVRVPLNLEMAVAEEIVAIACELGPDQATLVPEKRQEVTTEGGLDVAGNLERISAVVRRLRDAGIIASLFIDPERAQIEAAKAAGAEAVEIHTGRYAEACLLRGREREEASAKRLAEVVSAIAAARKAGLAAPAGHGLTYTNVVPVARIAGLADLNIGHSIISRAVFVGLASAVREMKELIKVVSRQ